MRYSVLVVILLLAACTDSAVTTEPPLSSSTVATTAPTTTPPSSTAPATTMPPSSTTTAAAEADESAVDETTVAAASRFVALPQPEEELPHTFGDVLIGGDGLLYIGDISPTPRDHPNETAFWHFDGATWQRTLLTEILPPSEHAGYAHTTNLVRWNGEYVGFLTNFDEDFASGPLLLTSPDGRDWQIEDLLSPAAGSIGSIYPTPESPPWPGVIGVSHLTTTRNEIVAVGWVSTDQGSAPAVWRSPDARSWSATLLPNSDSDREWAAQISIGDAGWLVTANGPYHSTNLLWFSPDGEDWTQVGEAFLEEDSWWSITEFAAGDTALVVATADFDGESTITQRWRSTNGTDWDKVGEPQHGFDRLLAIGSSIFSLIQHEATLAIEMSPDGEDWRTVAEFDVAPGDPWTEYFRLGSIEDSVTIARFQTTEDYVPTGTSVWFDSPVMDVVLVEADDTLNMRDGVMADVIGELEPNATGIATTGRSDGSAGSLWVEILHDGRLGWVNSRFLTQQVDDLAALEPLTAVGHLAELVFGDLDPIGGHVGPKGLSVAHFGETEWWSQTADPMRDETEYLWGSEGCGFDPACSPRTTFADHIAEGFLGAWNDDDRVTAIDIPIGNGNATIPEFVVPPQFRNFHYVAVHDPGDDPEYEGLDWVTWYVYFDVVDGEPLVVGMSYDTWAP